MTKWRYTCSNVECGHTFETVVTPSEAREIAQRHGSKKPWCTQCGSDLPDGELACNMHVDDFGADSGRLFEKE
jgi:hypothetical protein